MNLRHLYLRLFCRGFFLVLFALFTPKQGIAQSQEIDSLVSFLHANPRIDTVRAEVLSRLSFLLNSTDPRKGVTFGEEALKIAKMLGSDWSMARAHNSIGVNYFAIGESEKAVQSYLEAVRFQQKMGDERGVAMTRVNVGLLYWRKAKYADALREYFGALSYFEESTEENVKATIYLNQGQLYREIDDHQMAMDAFQKALAIGKGYALRDIEFNALNQIAAVLRDDKNYQESIKFRILAAGVAEREENKGRIATAYNRLALGFVDLNLGDSAVYFHKRALDVSLRYENKTQSASSYMGLGNIYRERKAYTESKTYYDKALAIYEESNDQRNIAGLWLETGRLHHNMKLTAQSRRDLEKSLEISRKSENLVGIVNSSQLLIESYEQTRNFDKALLYTRINQSAEDALDEENRLKDFARLESRFNSERERESLLAIQAEEESRLNAEIAEQKYIQRIAISGALILLILAIVYYRFYRIKASINKQLQQKNSQILQQKESITFQADKLKMINSQLKMLGEFKTGLTQMIAHDMKNPLNTIIGLSDGSLDKGKAKDVTNAGYQLLHLVTNMLDVDKYEQAEIKPVYELVQLDEIVLESKRQVEVLLGVKSIHLKNLIPKQICVNVDKELIIRVIVNLLTNAIKYSNHDGIVEISHTESDNPDLINLSVKDHGNGIPADRLPNVFHKFWTSGDKESGVGMSTGLGLTFCKMAVEAHKGEISAESKVGEGTTITFSIPLDTHLTGEAVWTEEKEEEIKNELILEAERLMIVGFSTHLRELKVYQVSDITKVLKRMEDKEIKSPWKSDLESAIYQGDQKRYDELVEMLD